MNYANTVNSRYTMLNIKEIPGLSALSSLGNNGSGYPLQVRRKAKAQRLQRAFRFYPAAFQPYAFVQHKNYETSI
jgi:hypothetical protein